MTQTALVTGVSGFIGSHWASYLLKKGWIVLSIEREKSKINPDLSAHKNYYKIIYNGSIPDLEHQLKNHQPSIVYHFATHFIAEHTVKDLDPLVDSNLRLGLHLLELSTRLRISHWINMGTLWQHYDDSVDRAANLYAATKQAFEALCKYYYEAKNLSLVTLHLSDTYGLKTIEKSCFTDYITTNKQLKCPLGIS